MRQAIHIFKKDVRYLWREIVIMLFVVAALIFIEVRHALRWQDLAMAEAMAWNMAKYLFPLAAWILIARLIHAEALPSDRQFWRTRPYAWKSLLAASLVHRGLHQPPHVVGASADPSSVRILVGSCDPRAAVEPGAAKRSPRAANGRARRRDHWIRPVAAYDSDPLGERLVIHNGRSKNERGIWQRSIELGHVPFRGRHDPRRRFGGHRMAVQVETNSGCSLVYRRRVGTHFTWRLVDILERGVTRQESG
jgi:hypothetical protein